MLSRSVCIACRVDIEMRERTVQRGADIQSGEGVDMAYIAREGSVGIAFVLIE